MPKHKLKRKSKYTAKQLYDMALDVAEYKNFLPLVYESEVFDVSDDGNGIKSFKGRMAVKAEKFKYDESFVSDVVADENALTIVSTASKGPVKSLVNAWKFTDLPEGGSQSEMKLKYKVNSMALRLLINASYGVAMDKLTEAFEDRADELYG